MTDTLEVITKVLREEVERSNGLIPLPVRTMLMRVVVRLDMEVQESYLDEVTKVLNDRDSRRDGGLDPDIAEMQKLVAAHDHQPVKEAMVLAAIKRGRELERQTPQPGAVPIYPDDYMNRHWR